MANQWYPFYPGDYARDTSHLSLVEHGAYRLLLDYYYATGGPLPCLEQCMRIACAMFEVEQKAVVNVVTRFFQENGEGGFNNKRADSEIYRQQDKALKAKEKAIKANAKRWGKDDAPSIPPSNPQAMHEDCLPQPQPQPYKEEPLKPIAQSDKSLPAVQVIQEDPIILLPLVDNTEFPIYQPIIDEFQTCYPAVDVLAQFREMRAWLISNKRLRKTKAGIMRFINTWLSKEQDKGYRVGNPPRPSSPTQARTERNAEAAREAGRLLGVYDD